MLQFDSSRSGKMGSWEDQLVSSEFRDEEEPRVTDERDVSWPRRAKEKHQNLQQTVFVSVYSQTSCLIIDLLLLPLISFLSICTAQYLLLLSKFPNREINKVHPSSWRKKITLLQPH